MTGELEYFKLDSGKDNEGWFLNKDIRIYNELKVENGKMVTDFEINDFSFFYF